MFPKLVFTLSFEESGMNFMGELQVQNGEVLKYNEEKYYQVQKEKSINKFLSVWLKVYQYF